nr:hypothetical protein [Anaerolineae bacterium]
MSILTASNLAKSYGPQDIFDEPAVTDEAPAAGRGSVTVGPMMDRLSQTPRFAGGLQARGLTN